MRRATTWILTGMMVFSIGACSRGEKKATAPEKTASGTAEKVVSAHGTSVLKWESDWEKAMARAKKENKPVVVDFYADWCVWCKTLDSTTYRDPKVVSLLSSKVVPLKIDVDHGGRQLARQWQVSGLPTILIVGPDGKERGRIPGYLPAADFLSEVSRHIGS